MLPIDLRGGDNEVNFGVLEEFNKGVSCSIFSFAKACSPSSISVLQSPEQLCSLAASSLLHILID